MRLTRACSLLLPLLAACSQLPGGDAQSDDIRYSSRVHKMPMHTANPTPGPSGAQLQYYGGHVIPNVKVVEVLYGSGTYAPEVSGAQLQSFYTQVVQSPFIDWLSEYDTNRTAVGGQPGTNQSIGRGTFGGKVSITPASANNGATITDSSIQAEIAAQIAAGHLPAPDANTLYMLHFPKGKAISQGGSSSCQSGGFCAYHGTFTRNGSSVYYGVMPDMSAGSGCDTGCGSNPTPFNNQTSVASHELIEAITDAEVGLATSNAPPLAWYDTTNGEIGDICNAQQGNFTGADGVTYVVQQEWSNTQGACVDHGTGTTPPPPPPPPPTTGGIANGGFESGLSGWTTSGQTSTSTTAHSGSGAAMVGSSSPSNDSSIAQTFTATSGAVLSFWYQTVCPDTVQYDWSSATLKDNTANTTTTLLANTCANTGSWVQVRSGTLAAGHSYTLTLANHDDNYPGDSTYTLYDDVTLSGATPPPTANDFSVSLAPSSVTVSAGGSATVQVSTALVSGSAQSIALSASGLPAGVTGSFSPASVTAGASSTLTLRAASNAAAATATFTVTGTATSGAHTASGSLSVSSTTPPPTGGITNGGFESGLTGWTTSGQTSTSTTAHSGSGAAMVGSSNPSNDSSIAQTFTAGSGAVLSFWYQTVCPDSVQYDWSSATLRDNTASTSTTLLANTCSNSGSWVQVTSGALAAGHSYTLTLSNHDDNYSGDATYTLYDDVTLSGSTPPPPANDFSLAVAPTSATVAPGNSAAYAVSTSVTSGSAESVSLSITGLPAGVTGSFSPATISSGASSTLTLTAASSAAGATGTFVITGSAASGSHAATASITVSGGTTNGFSLSINPASATVTAGSSTSFTVGSAVTSGSAQSISLSVSGLPSGVSGSFSPATLTAGGSSTLTLSASSTASGSGTFTVSGSASSGTQSVTASVSVSSGGTGTGVGPNGGSVDHLFFAVVGDTRPGSVDATSSYPTAIITRIYEEIQGLNPRPQFVIGTGDYMFANTTSNQAQPQLDLYMQARNAYTGTFFPAMGNHECTGYTAGNCTSTSQTQNLSAFMGTLIAPLGRSLPYYSWDVNAPDNSWTAKFVNIACNYWGSTQQSWLTGELSRSTTYTILSRHEPAHANTGPCVNTVESLMTQHPYNLSLVGHTHTFQFTQGSKEIIIGNGGAPITGSAPYGFATIEKVANGWQVKQYDYSTGLAMNTYTVP